MKRIATLRFDCCDACPYLKMERVYTADSFEHVTGWNCSKALKLIAELDWNDKKPPIPKWCPLIEK